MTFPFFQHHTAWKNNNVQEAVDNLYPNTITDLCMNMLPPAQKKKAVPQDASEETLLALLLPGARRPFAGLASLAHSQHLYQV